VSTFFETAREDIPVADCNPWIEVLKVVPLYAAGGWALYKYVEDQKWKQQQFATALFRNFAEKSSTRTAMMMLDWTRRVELFPEKSGDERLERVRAEDIIDALRVEDRTHFSPKEVRIRDIFDQFLGDLAEFNHHIESGLIKIAQISPYLQYWAKLMTGHGHRKRADLWSSVNRFIDCYDYKAVKDLFGAMGYFYEQSSMPPSPGPRELADCASD
jgi:hypothetical protein